MAEENNNKKPKSHGTAALVLSIISLIIGLGGAGLAAFVLFNPNAKITFLNSGPDGNSATFVEGSISEIASKVGDSVVSIITETRTSSWYGTYSSNAAGTGFIITTDGYVVTNKHVIEGARSVAIITADGTEYDDVDIVGRDPLNDVAVLRIKNVTDLKPVTLGDSKTISSGQQVIAIGNALGAYQNTVTSGIISGTGRSLVATDSTGSSAETLSDMIQTDAAINGGNSGGPLVNAAGEVIGINTAYANDSNNIGFAIPISSVKGLLRDVEKTGRVKRAVLGVRYYTLTPAIAEEYDLDITSGAYIYGSSNSSVIVSGSAAEKAGLKAGDIIVAVNGVKIGQSGSLSTLIGEYSIGETITLVIHRDSQDFEVNATLTEYKQ